MSQKQMDGLALQQWFHAGHEALTARAGRLDALNVFPVPDGDTGKNMQGTVASGIKEMESKASGHVGEVAQAFAKGLLMGARGNSGVILSQLFRGLAKTIAAQSTLDVKGWAEGLQAGVDLAYESVAKPVEGTLLTVAKEAADTARNRAGETEDLETLMEAVLASARTALQKTPDLLPVLKEAGVVDSGGQGLVYIYEGFLAALKGESPVTAEERRSNEMEPYHQVHMKAEDITFGYCTEFFVRRDASEYDEAPFRHRLSEYGDSLLVVSDEEWIKVHIHAEYPGEVLTLSQQYGELQDIKIENMRCQHSAIVQKNAANRQESARFGFVAVGSGAGVADLFRSAGVNEVIDGGQTMNPSTEEILEAVNRVDAEHVIVLPNNGNIMMAAQQAVQLSDISAEVVDAQTIPQGIAAMLAFDPSQDVEANLELMMQAAQQVKTGQVTYAVRDSSFSSRQIKEGDYIGIQDGEIRAASEDVTEVVQSLILQMVQEEDELLSVIYGEDVQEEQIEELADWLQTRFPDMETEYHEGKQPIYDFIFSVE